MLSKKNKFKEVGIGAEEALNLLHYIIVQNKSNYKNNREEVFALISVDLMSTRKRTIHNRRAFEDEVRKIIREYRKKIKKRDYLEFKEEILKLFRDETKSKMRLYLDENVNIIAMVLGLITLLATILMPIIVKFLLIQIQI